MREFIVAQRSSNDYVKNQLFNLKTKVEHGQKNHQAMIQDIETKFGQLSDQLNVVFIRSGKTYDPPVNPNDKTFIIHDDSEDEANKAEKDEEPSSSKRDKSDPPPLKAYKPKIPYPQCLRKEKMEERYAKFIDLIKEVRINVPLVDVLAGMPNYGKFLKDLVRNKSKMEKISTAFLNEECSAIVQNKLSPKLVKRKELNLGVGDDRITFLIDKSMQHSHSSDDTCFRMDVVDKITKEELDALLNDSEPFLNVEEILEQKEEVGDNFEKLPLKEKLSIKTSIQEPPTDLEMKPLPNHLEYAFLEKDSLLSVVISALFKDDEKKCLVSVLKNHKEAFAWKTSDIPGISPSFCKH
ncbi:hypothetical protein Tco_1005670 [Tanacetum coccineum]|uniref:Reverse transcriptase domain-containing protein n=1 Tax=Tanacetum coccineum TaxID=301880 RepID=A0ABQ5FHV4_9ASTR